MTLKELYAQADYKDYKGMMFNADCMQVMSELGNGTVDLTITDIPYGSVNRSDNGLRKLDKGNADIETFNVLNFCSEVDRVTNGTIVIFAV